MCLGKKIKQFESKSEQRLKEFNEVFNDSQIDMEQFAPEAEVEIGEIIGPSNVRRVLVGDKEILHTFNISSTLPSLSTESGGNSEAKLWFNKGGGMEVTTNANTENLVMTEKEMDLDPREYVLLQYLRGSQSVYHTQLEIADRLRMSVRTVRNLLTSMENKEIVQISSIVNLHRTRITLTQDWE